MMKVWKQIKVIFFLGIMGIMMLHDALPHVHHSHVTHGQLTKKARAHHHAHGHADHHRHQHVNHRVGAPVHYQQSAQVDQQVKHHSDSRVGNDRSQIAGHQVDADDVNHAHQAAAHHSNDQENEKNVRGLLVSFVLNNHAHSFHTPTFIPLIKPGNHYVLDKHVPIGIAIDPYQSFADYENQFLHRYSLFKQAYTDGPLSRDSPPRGPPSIG